jgi:hypothetical protein
MEQIIKLELTLQDVNLILEALSNMPFKSVFQLVTKVQQQGENQLKPKENKEVEK